MRGLLIVALVLILIKPGCIYSQKKDGTDFISRPKLVVGIVVDQMRNDYIYRYWSRFGPGGFKRLVNLGYYFKNTHYNYVPTFTGPGHCSIYTGAPPRVHGIIANDWFNKSSGTNMYCVEDSSVRTVGSNDKNGLMSPRNQLSSTLGDELKMSTNQQAKVYSVALKDRSSILPAGHTADAAFWYDDTNGNFISSTWYLKELPEWLLRFNARKLPATYLEMGWNTLYPIETYSNSIRDGNGYEAAANKKENPVFPYDYSLFLKKGNVGILKATPFGNTLTKELALECLKSELLGRDNIPDLLCISFSSADLVAHAHGPRSVETEDMYLRLDKDLEELLNELDRQVGKDDYTVFLTADHGGADVPNHLLDNRIPAGYIQGKRLGQMIRAYLQENYNDSTLLANLSNEQIFLSEKRLNALKLNKDELEEKLAGFIITLPGISEAYPSKVMREEAYAGNDYRSLLQNGYNHKMSGNVCFIYEPGWMENAPTGTTHGAVYNYDTHVPLIFYGKGIPSGESFTYATITQIAPTVCELLQINQPNSTLAQPLNNWFKK